MYERPGDQKWERAEPVDLPEKRTIKSSLLDGLMAFGIVFVMVILVLGFIFGPMIGFVVALFLGAIAGFYATLFGWNPNNW